MLIQDTQFDYHIKGARSENCILIDTDNWLVNDSNEIIEFNQWGGISRTFITRALSVNVHKNSKYEGILRDGDVVMITQVSANVYGCRYFTIPINLDSTHYTDIPMAHVIGKFDKKVSFDSFQPITNYVLSKTVEDIDVVNEILTTSDRTLTVQEVVKVGPWVKGLSVGDYVLVRDNVSTEISLDGSAYNAYNSEMVVGVFDNPLNIDFDFLTPFGTAAILVPEQTVYAHDGSQIFNPYYNPDEDKDGITEIDTNRFRVLKSALPELKENDIVFVPKNVLNSVTFRGKEYFSTTDTQFMLAKITGE